MWTEMAYPVAMTSPPSTTGSAQRRWLAVAGFPVLLAAALITTVIIFANRSIADPDIWWHLRNAEQLVRTGHFVRTDVYSFTVQGTAWLDHEWLGELPYYFAWSWLGLRGLYLVMVLALATIFSQLYYLSYLRSGYRKAAALATGLMIPLATVSFGPRTLLFGWIFLLIELIILQRFRSRPHALWLLPPLFAVWANTHGSWIIGLTLLSTFAVAQCWDFSLGRIVSLRANPPELRRLTTVLALSIGALFVNPYGWRLVFYPLDLAFRQKLNISHVEEWQSPDFHTFRGKLLLVLLLSFLVLLLVRYSRWVLHEVFFVLIAFYSALTYSRFLFLAAIILAPLLAYELRPQRPVSAEADKPWLNLAFMAAMALIVACQVPSEARLRQGIAAEYPAAAMQYLRSFAPDGRVLNDYDWGGYLIWNARHIPVFVDSRVDIFEYRGVFGDYLEMMGLKNSLDLLGKYHIRYVLFGRDKPLAYLLRNSPQWNVLYEDKVAVLFQRAK